MPPTGYIQCQFTTPVISRVSNMKSWTVPVLSVFHTYWLKKLTIFHEPLAAQKNHSVRHHRSYEQAYGSINYSTSDRNWQKHQRGKTPATGS